MRRDWTFDEADLVPHWGRLLAVGIVMIVLGVVAIVFARQSTIASVMVYGWLIMLAGAVEFAASFWAMRASRVILHLLSGVLGIVVGILLVVHPNAGAQALTLLLAVLFLAGGLFRFSAALTFGFPDWGWDVAAGIVTVVLGFLIWMQWPAASTWLIGTFVGIDFIVRGWTWAMAAAAIRNVTRHAEARP
ncbi:MAG TPA: HdeD family acid-resistance protein [Myxococcales bacterium]|nr:HdeD family acid-resistance protein [Myxococcales bacterium]